jgi:hypothetical protein
MELLVQPQVLAVALVDQVLFLDSAPAVVLVEELVQLEEQLEEGLPKLVSLDWEELVEWEELVVLEPQVVLVEWEELEVQEVLELNSINVHSAIQQDHLELLAQLEIWTCRPTTIRQDRLEPLI